MSTIDVRDVNGRVQVRIWESGIATVFGPETNLIQAIKEDEFKVLYRELYSTLGLNGERITYYKVGDGDTMRLIEQRDAAGKVTARWWELYETRQHPHPLSKRKEPAWTRSK